MLPFMNLFAILIPFLLSVAVFEKLGILELNLPERSDSAPPDINVDPMKLNLSVIITDEYLMLAASGGFGKNVYYKEEVKYRSKSDNHIFFKEWDKTEEVKSPTDGKVMTPYEKDVIFLHYLERVDSTDPGKYVMVAHNQLGEPMVDTAGEFYDRLPAPGEKYSIVGSSMLRTMNARDNTSTKLEKLSAYSSIARDLWLIMKQAEKRENPPDDLDTIIILANNRIIYDKIIHVMDAAKYAGFSKISLSLLGG